MAMMPIKAEWRMTRPLMQRVGFPYQIERNLEGFSSCFARTPKYPNLRGEGNSPGQALAELVDAVQKYERWLFEQAYLDAKINPRCW